MLEDGDVLREWVAAATGLAPANVVWQQRDNSVDLPPPAKPYAELSIIDGPRVTASVGVKYTSTETRYRAPAEWTLSVRLFGSAAPTLAERLQLLCEWCGDPFTVESIAAAVETPAVDRTRVETIVVVDFYVTAFIAFDAPPAVPATSFQATGTVPAAGPDTLTLNVEVP